MAAVAFRTGGDPSPTRAFAPAEPQFWTRCPDAAIEDPNLTHFAVRLLLWLARWERIHPGRFPTMAEAALSFDVHRSLIARTFAILETAGYLILTRGPGGHRHFARFGYTFRTPGPRAAMVPRLNPQRCLPFPEEASAPPELPPAPPIVAAEEPAPDVAPVQHPDVAPVQHPHSAQLKERAGEQNPEEREIKDVVRRSFRPVIAPPRGSGRKPWRSAMRPPADVVDNDPILRAERDRREQARAKALALEAARHDTTNDDLLKNQEPEGEGGNQC